MHTIFLALGSNVGDKKANIFSAIDMMKEHVSGIVVAPLYETKPWGFTQQDNFYNTVVEGQTDLLPEALFDFVKSVEARVGRIQRFTNGPREIDIDILLYDTESIAFPHLTVPHPSMQDRDFVLKPLSDLAPDYVHPVLKKTIKELLALIPKEQKSIRGIIM